MKLKLKPFAISITVILLFIISISAFSQQKVIEEHFKSLNKHDVAAITSGYSPDAQMYSANWEGVKTGSADINEVYKRYFQSSPDLVYKITHVINANDNVVVEYTTSGTLSNPEAQTPSYMKDKKYVLNYCAIYSIKNDKIIKETDYFDQVAFLRQVGFFEQR